MRRVLGLALLASAVANGFLCVWNLGLGGYWLTYVFSMVQALSAYGCWVAGKYVIERERARKVSTPAQT